MSWLKLDDQIFLNRKVAQCDASTKLLYIVGLSYCANQLTDGYIPEATLPLLAGMAGLDWQIAKQSAGKLLEVCLWSATPDGWQIPDYLEYNPSREQVIHNAQVRSDAGRAGGRAKASKLPSKTLANNKQNPSKIVPPSPSPSDDDRERRQALEALQEFGLFNATMLAQFNDMWPELAGRRDWVGKAITVARDKRASSPQYALKVLANSIHTGKEPGYVNGESRDADTRPRVPAPSREEQAAADARQAEYERQIAEQLARAGKL